MYITIRRRQVPLEGAQRFTDLSEEEKEAEIRERRAAIVEEYLAVTESDISLQNLLDLCELLVNADVDIERKYVELDIRRVFEANKVSLVFRASYCHDKYWGFIKSWAPGKLTGCERDLAINLPGCFHLLFLLSFIRKTKSAWLKTPLTSSTKT